MSVTIDGRLDQSVVGVDSVTVPGECVAIDNTFHPANKRLNLATAVRNVISAFGIEWRGEPDRTNGHFARSTGRARRRECRPRFLPAPRCTRSLTFSALFAIAAIAWAFLVRGESGHAIDGR